MAILKEDTDLPTFYPMNNSYWLFGYRFSTIVKLHSITGTIIQFLKSIEKNT